RPGEPSRPARTRWRVLERFARAALLEVELATGRQHQIRVHLAHARLPVLGDEVYGAPSPHRPPIRVRRQMLHAGWLRFVHPVTGETVAAESPPPPDFREAAAALRRQVRAAPPPSPGRSPRRPGPRRAGV
ncbi:MAG TPA: pseudouridine synthase, partial [Vicinamibacteria bacterium]|nr:pseudouridine synthase [Vicinamibacteria bacterium]